MGFTSEQQTIIDDALQSEGIPGVAVSMVKDGEIIAEGGFGYRELDAKLPMTAHTVSPICSLTKSMTGVGIMQLVEMGQIWLDEPVTSYIPHFRLADEKASRKITPRMLLSHKSGMGRTGHQARMYEDTIPYEDRADLVRRLADVELQTPPNKAWSYCNEGYVTLGHLTELLRGSTLEYCFQNNIFHPVGMNETYVRFADWRSAPDRSHTYTKKGEDYEETKLADDYSIYLSTGGICSTAHDLALYQIATMDYENNPILKAGSLEQMHTISMPYGDTGWGYGMGWEIRWDGPRKIVAHSGGLPGVATYSLMIPSEKIGVIVLSNLGGAGVRELAEQLAATVLGEPIFRESTDKPMPFETRVRLSVSRLGEYEGAYQLREESRASVKAGTSSVVMTIQTPDSDDDVQTARAVGQDFFLTDKKASPLTFVRGDDGRVSSLLFGGEQYKRIS